ncbi:LysR family transcriptional regulator [Pseudomonas sp. NPDC090755]|uniref:LysR family transcriptional regulator n=1 Tax=Pseudomonas sp. NPDC090755 TaxID=3364481 RepID=UPI00383A107A
MLTLKQLKHLQAIHQHGSIHRAAEALHITQPALTRSLANLEETLGVRLFDRSKSGMQATEFYLKIRERCSQLLLESEEIEREANLYRNLESGQLSLGVGRASRELVLRSVLPEFVRRHRQISVQVREGVSEELVFGLKNGHYDLIIAGVGSYGDIEGLASEPLKDFSVSVLTRHDHPLVERHPATLKELLGYPMISATELSPNHPLFARLPILNGQQASVLCSDFQVLRQILLETDAWMAAPEQQFHEDLAQGKLARLDLADWSLSIELSAIELAGRSRSPAAQRFIDLCHTNL